MLCSVGGLSEGSVLELSSRWREQSVRRKRRNRRRETRGGGGGGGCGSFQLGPSRAWRLIPAVPCETPCVRCSERCPRDPGWITFVNSSASHASCRSTRGTRDETPCPKPRGGASGEEVGGLWPEPCGISVVSGGAERPVSSPSRAFLPKFGSGVPPDGRIRGV